MKDIRLLYHTAKHSRRSSDIQAYNETVQHLLEQDPLNYMLQLEYIIQSDLGMGTFEPFVEKYGIPIALYPKVISCMESCQEKAEKQGHPGTAYQEWVEKLTRMEEQYQPCFDLFGQYMESAQIRLYLETYYHFTNGIQNSHLTKGMLERFHEMAIPDLLMLADSMGESAVLQTLDYVAQESAVQDPTFCELILESVECLHLEHYQGAVRNWFGKRALSTLVQETVNRTNTEYREHVLAGDYNYSIPYTGKEIGQMLNLIALKEYQLCGITDESILMEHFDNILDLYQELDGLVTESGDVIEEDSADLVNLLPQQKAYQEDLSWANTLDKKTSDVPGYLGSNHDASKIGEGDGDSDDYRRPSNHTSSEPSYSEDDSEEDIPSDPNDDDSDSENMPSDGNKGNVTNYYYYTYTNSLNRNQNSFNKRLDNSRHDDNRVTNITHGPHHNINHTYASDGTPKLEAADPAAPDKPESDHPIRDTMMDLDRKAAQGRQKIKHGMQTVQQAAIAAARPIKKTDQWIMKTISKWKDAKENRIKEQMADPHARKNLYSAIKRLIIEGSLLKAGLLLNPVFIMLRISNAKKAKWMRQEIISELKTEMEIVNEKIQDQPNTPEGNANKYKLMRFRNELNKKLLRVGGGKGMEKLI